MSSTKYYRDKFAGFNWKWKLKTLLKASSKPHKYRKFFGDSLRLFEEKELLNKFQTLPSVPVKSIVNPSLKIELLDPIPEGPSITFLELLSLLGFIIKKSPKTLLEIGSLNGMTTLQMALNAPSDACVHTLDLPDEDLYQDYLPGKRRYVGTEYESKISQHFGNSITYDFSHFTKKGLIDFAFIDGDHSYDFVKNDTEKVLERLAPGGTLVWHDYHPHHGDVFHYLNEIQKQYPLKHIEGTMLAFYEKN